MATLALHDGEVVGSGRLIQIVWGKPASPALVNTLQSHLSYLRHALGSKTVILARSPGYERMVIGFSGVPASEQRMVS